MSRRRKFGVFSGSPFGAKVPDPRPLSARARIAERELVQPQEADPLLALILATPIPFHRHCPARRFGKWARPCAAEMHVVYTGERFHWVCPTGKHPNIPIQRSKLELWIKSQAST